MILRVTITCRVADEVADRLLKIKELSSILGTNQVILHFSHKKTGWEKEDIFTQ
jgi:hypothetical protein